MFDLDDPRGPPFTPGIGVYCIRRSGRDHAGTLSNPLR
jgi:hypothetical protein